MCDSNNKRALRDLSISFIEDPRTPKKSREHDSTPTEIEVSVKSPSEPIMQSTPNATAEQGTQPTADPNQQGFHHQYVFSSPVTISAEDIQKIAEAVRVVVRESLREEMSQMIAEKVKPLCIQVDKLRDENKQLKMQLDELEQYGKRPLIRISGIPESSAEDTKAKIIDVTTKAGIELSPDDIINSHRVGKPRNGPRQIIARLKSVDTKFGILKDLKKLRSHNDTKNVRINEDLTKFRDRLMYLCRQLCRRGRLSKVWSSNGKISVKDINGKVYHIREESELVQFGHDIRDDI